MVQSVSSPSLSRTHCFNYTLVLHVAPLSLLFLPKKKKSILWAWGEDLLCFWEVKKRQSHLQGELHAQKKTARARIHELAPGSRLQTRMQTYTHINFQIWFEISATFASIHWWKPTQIHVRTRRNSVCILSCLISTQGTKCDTIILKAQLVHNWYVHDLVLGEAGILFKMTIYPKSTIFDFCLMLCFHLVFEWESLWENHLWGFLHFNKYKKN